MPIGYSVVRGSNQALIIELSKFCKQAEPVITTRSPYCLKDISRSTCCFVVQIIILIRLADSTNFQELHCSLNRTKLYALQDLAVFATVHLINKSKGGIV